MDEHLLSEYQDEIIKAFGHKSRTLLNGITGPVQIIRSLSDEPQLIEPLRILELSVSRFEKFSTRVVLILELLQNRWKTKLKSLELNDIVKYIILDLSDYIDFFKVEVTVNDGNAPVKILSDYYLLNNLLQIMLELSISLSNQNSTILVDIKNTDSSIEVLLTCNDNGLLQKSLKPVLDKSHSPAALDIDVYLLKLCSGILNYHLDFFTNTAEMSTIKLQIT